MFTVIIIQCLQMTLHQSPCQHVQEMSGTTKSEKIDASDQSSAAESDTRLLLSWETLIFQSNLFVVLKWVWFFHVFSHHEKSRSYKYSCLLRIWICLRRRSSGEHHCRHRGLRRAGCALQLLCWYRLNSNLGKATYLWITYRFLVCAVYFICKACTRGLLRICEDWTCVACPCCCSCCSCWAVTKLTGLLPAIILVPAGMVVRMMFLPRLLMLKKSEDTKALTADHTSSSNQNDLFVFKDNS